MSAEKWLAIQNYEGFYEISDQGRVKSLPRTVERRSRWGTVAQIRIRGRILRPHTRRDGYSAVALCEGGQPRTQLVHRLVLEAFVGPCPPGTVACHENNRRSDNRLVNLSWGRHKRREAAAA